MISLIIMMILVVFLATIELDWIIIMDVITPPIILLEIDELLEIFGFFLLVLIGVELLETIRAYLRENVIHVEIVIVVALIAIARKVITFDPNKYESLTLLAIAALILSLAVAYHFIKRRSRDIK